MVSLTPSQARPARSKRARTDTALSIASGLAGQGALVVTGTIAARALGVEQRGTFAFIFLVSQVVATFGTLGVPIALTYFIAPDPARTRRLGWRLHRFLPTQLVVVTVVHGGLLLALFWSGDGDIKIAAAISLVTSSSQVAQQYGLGVLQGLRQFRWFNVLRLVGPVGYAVAAVLFWVAERRSLIDMTVAYTGAYLFAALATVAAASLSILPLDRSTRDGDPSTADMVRFGLKGLLGAASPLETFRIDQSVVGLFLAPAALGLYVSAVAFTNLPKFIAQSIGMVAYPYVARHTDDHARRVTMWRFVAFATLACAGIVAALELTVGWLIPLMFGESFKGAIPVARVLLIAGFLIGVRRILSDGARGIGKPGVGTIAELTSWAVLVPALLVCVQLGLVAVALSLTACAAVSVGILLLLLLLRRHQPLPTRSINVAPMKS